MPIPRTSSSRSRQPLQPQPTPPNVDHEIIVLSSDSDHPPPRKIKRTAKERAKSRALLRPVTAGEVIELTDSGDDVPAPRPKKTASSSRLEAKIKRLEDENRHLKEEVSRLSIAVSKPEDFAQELELVRADKEAAVCSKKKLLSTLEEYVTCEICTLKMWSPYILCCGHTFCVDCLQDWFNTALVQHMTNNPDWSPNPPGLAQYRYLLQQPNLPAHTRYAIEMQHQQVLAQIPQPNYTCPSCRMPVRKSPIEAFSLKNIVRAVAEAEGETSPRHGGTGTGRRDDLWSGFFPQTNP